jgi:hypothetical protein
VIRLTLAVCSLTGSFEFAFFALSQSPAKMSPQEKAVKRQRPADASQDAKAGRSKRLKTDVVLHEGDAVVALSGKKKKPSEWSLDLIFRGNICNVDPVFSVDEKYVLSWVSCGETGLTNNVTI